MRNGDLLYLALLFGVWLAVVAIINFVSVRREAGGRRTPGVRTVRRWTLAVGIGLVIAYLTAAVPASQLVAADTGYSIMVAAFAACATVQSAFLLPSLVHARRLRTTGS
jgi:hypothetical protein